MYEPGSGQTGFRIVSVQLYCAERKEISYELGHSETYIKSYQNSDGQDQLLNLMIYSSACVLNHAHIGNGSFSLDKHYKFTFNINR